LVVAGGSLSSVQTTFCGHRESGVRNIDDAAGSWLLAGIAKLLFGQS